MGCVNVCKSIYSVRLYYLIVADAQQKCRFIADILAYYADCKLYIQVVFQ